MNKSWQERIDAAESEISETENTEFGVYVTTASLVRFFVSESVIPNQCKEICKGRVKSYNLAGIDQVDLIVKEVFRVKHRSDRAVVGSANIGDIADRMQALWLILEHDHSVYGGIAQSIIQYALLGAIASLFTAFDDHPHYADVLNFQYRKTFRKFAFHFKALLLKEGLESLKILAVHFYEHCREELMTVRNFMPLRRQCSHVDRFSANFKRWLVACLDSHPCFIEYNNRVIKMLADDKADLERVIAFLKKNPYAFSAGEQPNTTCLAICGNAVGLLVSNLSANTMSLLKNRTYSTAMLSDEERRTVNNLYGKFVQIGIAYRHNKILYTALPGCFALKVGRQPKSRKSEKKLKLLTSRSANFFSQNSLRAPAKTIVTPRIFNVNVKRYACLMGVLPNGVLACTEDAETLQLINVSDGNIKQALSLNPAAQKPTSCFNAIENYFKHACSTAPILLLKNNTMIIGAYQYLHVIDLDMEQPEPEKITLLKTGGVTRLLELNDLQVAVGDGAGNVFIFDPVGVQFKHVLSPPVGLSNIVNPVLALVKMPEDRLGVGYNNGTIGIWNLRTAECEILLSACDDVEFMLAYNTGRNRQFSKQPRVRRGGKPMGGVMCLEITADGNLFAGYGDNVIYLWDLNKKRPIKSYIGHTDWPLCIKALPEGKLLTTGIDKTVMLWGLDNHERSVDLNHEGHSLEILQDSIVVADRNTSSAFLLSELTCESTMSSRDR